MYLICKANSRIYKMIGGDAEIGRFVDVRNNIKGNREIVFKMQEEDLSGEKYDLEVIFSGSETSDVTKLTAPVIERYKNM